MAFTGRNDGKVGPYGVLTRREILVFRDEELNAAYGSRRPLYLGGAAPLPAGACTLHADSPREAFERLATLMGSDMGVSPRDAVRMISASMDILVQIGIVNEVRRLTSIARVDKKLHGGEAWFVPLWRFDVTSPTGEPQWRREQGSETSK